MFGRRLLGLDNIGVFNRSAPLNDSMHLEQADGMVWMGMYALNLLDMVLEIAMHDPSFEDAATKFLSSCTIAEAINHHGMWNEEDEFFYDTLFDLRQHTDTIEDPVGSWIDQFFRCIYYQARDDREA
jgi:hypothetical protein